MNDLPPEARSLIAAARRSDGRAPPGPRLRMRRGLVGALALSTAASAGSLTFGKVVLVALASSAVGSGATLAVNHLAARQDSRRTPTARAELETHPDVPPPVSGRATAAPAILVPAFSPAPLATPAPGPAPSSPPMPPRASATAGDELPVSPASPKDPGATGPGGDPFRTGAWPRGDTQSPRTVPAPLESLESLDLSIAPPSTAPVSPSRPRADEFETPDIPPSAITPAAPAVRRSEAAELAGAYSAVAERRWAQAKVALDAYRQHYPSGKLALEAEVLEVLVRCGEGQGALARQLAERLEARAPTNPAVQRLRGFCQARTAE